MVAKQKLERQYLTAITIAGGIITLIEPDGSVGHYCQRGMNRLDKLLMQQLIKKGLVDRRWSTLKELPKHYSISFEDPEMMGRAYATFKVR